MQNINYSVLIVMLALATILKFAVAARGSNQLTAVANTDTAAAKRIGSPPRHTHLFNPMATSLSACVHKLK